MDPVSGAGVGIVLVCLRLRKGLSPLLYKWLNLKVRSRSLYSGLTFFSLFNEDIGGGKVFILVARKQRNPF